MKKTYFDDNQMFKFYIDFTQISHVKTFYDTELNPYSTHIWFSRRTKLVFHIDQCEKIYLEIIKNIEEYFKNE